MIKVSFNSVNATDDICEILENEITGQKSLDVWLCENISTIEFDCMDFPYDSEAFYDCYFKSENDELVARDIYRLLKRTINKQYIEFSIFIVDDRLECLKEI